jgi:hypothetical protein
MPTKISPNPAIAIPIEATRPPRAAAAARRSPTSGSADETLIFTRSPISETSHPVLVVPTAAPKITPTACAKVNNPALTKPMVITIVALDDCTSMPSRRARRERRSDPP